MNALRMTATSAILLMAGSAAAHAALAPNYQRSRELVAVIQAVAAALEDHPIDQVLHQGGFVYRVLAGPCSIVATILPKPDEGLMGAMQFTVELGGASCDE